jgi:hypothetical protein
LTAGMCVATDSAGRLRARATSVVAFVLGNHCNSAGYLSLPGAGVIESFSHTESGDGPR